MITVAIAEMFFFVENSPLSDWTGGENGLPGVPTPTLRSRLRHARIQHRLVDVRVPRRSAISSASSIALRIVRSPVGAILSAIRDNPLRARGASATTFSGYKLTAFVDRRGLCRPCRRPARRAAGLHAARCVHVRHLRPARDADRDRRRRHAVRPAARRRASGCSCRTSCRRRSVSARAWKLVLGVVFVLLVCFLRHGIIGGISDLYGYLRARNGTGRAAEAPAERRAPMPSRERQPPRRCRARHRDARRLTPGRSCRRRGLTKRYGGLARQQRHRLHGQPRRVARHHRPERRRQDAPSSRC